MTHIDDKKRILVLNLLEIGQVLVIPMLVITKFNCIVYVIPYTYIYTLFIFD